MSFDPGFCHLFGKDIVCMRHISVDNTGENWDRGELGQLKK